MAYAAYFQWVKPRMKPGDRLRVIPEGKTCRVNKPVSDLPKSCLYEFSSISSCLAYDLELKMFVFL
jgi:hypothetical protein